MATDIKFYHLTREPITHTLPKLAARAYQNKHRTVIRVLDAARVAAIDDLLWTFDDQSFLPHGTAKNDYLDLQPIFITDTTLVPNAATLLILLDTRLDDDLDQFEKCFYLFDGTHAPELEAARQGWATLKKQNHVLSYWQQNDAGRWEQKA